MSKLLTVEEAAEIRRVSTKTIRRWIKAGIISGQRFKGQRRILILESDLFASPYENAQQ